MELVAKTHDQEDSLASYVLETEHGPVGSAISAAELQALRDGTPEQRRTAALTATGDMRHAFIRTAAIAVVMDDAGDDRPDFWTPKLWGLLLDVGRNRLIPELATGYSSKPMPWFRAIKQLPVEDQRRLVDGEPLKVVTRSRDGDDFTHILVRIQDVDSKSIGLLEQAIGPEGIRTEAQQRSYLVEQDNTSYREARKRSSLPEYVVDSKRHQLTVNQPRVFTKAELLEILAAI